MSDVEHPLNTLSTQKTARLASWAPLVLNAALIALFTLFAPAEKTLGTNARLVYLHGAIVWSAILAFSISALLGLAGLLTWRSSRQPVLHSWSTAFARTGLALWLVQVPMSLLVMQLNWGGLFLDEPRWRISVTFAVVGVLLQAASALIGSRALTLALNLVYGAALVFTLNGIVSVMHPNSPIIGSSASAIQLFFAILIALNCALAGQLAYRMLVRSEPLGS